MAKTKKMALGGMGDAANAAMQSVKAAPRTYAAPAGTPKANMGGGTAGPSQMQFMSDKLRGKPSMPPPAGPSQMQFMSDKLRGKPSMPPPAGPGKMQGLGQAMSGNPQMAQNLGKVAGAAMGGMGMKKGGTASSRADGCAIQGKTKGRFA